jgi:hypothetical protein
MNGRIITAAAFSGGDTVKSVLLSTKNSVSNDKKWKMLQIVAQAALSSKLFM